MLIPLATVPAHPRYWRLTPQVASLAGLFLPGLVDRPDHQAAAAPAAPGGFLQPRHREPAHLADVFDQVVEPLIMEIT